MRLIFLARPVAQHLQALALGDVGAGRRGDAPVEGVRRPAPRGTRRRTCRPRSGPDCEAGARSAGRSRPTAPARARASAARKSHSAGLNKAGKTADIEAARSAAPRPAARADRPCGDSAMQSISARCAAAPGKPLCSQQSAAPPASRPAPPVPLPTKAVWMRAASSMAGLRGPAEEVAGGGEVAPDDLSGQAPVGEGEQASGSAAGLRAAQQAIGLAGSSGGDEARPLVRAGEGSGMPAPTTEPGPKKRGRGLAPAPNFSFASDLEAGAEAAVEVAAADVVDRRCPRRCRSEPSGGCAVERRCRHRSRSSGSRRCRRCRDVPLEAEVVVDDRRVTCGCRPSRHRSAAVRPAWRLLSGKSS